MKTICILYLTVPNTDWPIVQECNDWWNKQNKHHQSSVITDIIAHAPVETATASTGSVSNVQGNSSDLNCSQKGNGRDIKTSNPGLISQAQWPAKPAALTYRVRHESESDNNPPSLFTPSAPPSVKRERKANTADFATASSYLKLISIPGEDLQ